MTANGHSDLPDEQGNANTPVETGSGQKTATSHSESDPDGIGSDPKIETDHAEKPSASEPDGIDSGPNTVTDPAATAHGKTAIETSPADDALDRLTANGKRSESASDETGHENCPTANRLDDPSVLLEPKIGKHGRNKNGSGPPKTRVLDSSPRRACRDERGEATEEGAERATGIRCERAASTSSAREGAEETEARSRTADKHPEAFPPLSLDTGRADGRRGSPMGSSTRCIPRPPPPPPLNPPF